ncbi:hypothetical protein ACIPW5_20800 [Streptomyces sp. NPDC090077]|uniref:hypothetical protein n=1 Tax=Streptomyces sp. NPDC090077 TaxID=3365938 RepID=UPI003824993E
MHRRNRHTLLCAALASSVALGTAAALAVPASAAPAAVPAASCTVTPDPSGKFVVITGEGFTAPRNLNDGESTERLNIDANGNFRLQRFQKNVDYTVLAVNEDQNFVFVNCKVAAAKPPSSTTPQGTQQDYRRGYLSGVVAGRQAGQEGCKAQPVADKSQTTRSENYWKGWTAGATQSYARICGSSSTG